MCELFGFSGAMQRNLTSSLAEFFSHSPEHPDGWGLATREHGVVSVEKEYAQASNSSYLLRRLTSGVTTSLALGHIRKATVGTLNRNNCHPHAGTDCTGRQWTLIHNGTIFDFPELDRFRAVQSGSTDSERVLLFFLDCIDRATVKAGHALTAQERFAVLDEAVCRLSANNNKLNFLLFDGEVLFAHTNYEASLHTCTTAQGTLFSTHPLSMGNWEPLAFTTLVAYAEGTQIMTGTNHGNVSVDAPELLEALRHTVLAEAC